MGITGIAFSLGFAALLFLAFYNHPRYGLYAYMVAYYVHPPSRWWGKALPDVRWALLAAGVSMLAIWLNRNKFQSDRDPWVSSVVAKVLIVLAVWIWIQNIWAMSPDMHREMSILYAKYLLLFYLIYTIADSPEEIWRLLLIHVGGCLYLGYLAYGANVDGRLEGVGGPDINEANALGMQLATGIVCGSMFILLDRTWRWFFSAVGVVLALNGLVLTGSRGAFLSLIVGGVALAFMRPQENRKLFLWLAACAIATFFYVASDTFLDRIRTIGAAVDETQEMDTSAESRFVIIDAQVKMALRYPLGTGHRGTEVLSREYIPPEYLTVTPDGRIGARSSHNTFMTAWVEQGVPGAIMFLTICGWCFLTSVRLRRGFPRFSPEVQGAVAGISAALVVFFCAGVFVDYMKAEVQIWLYALLAALVSLRKKGALQVVRQPPDIPAGAGYSGRSVTPRAGLSLNRVREGDLRQSADSGSCS